LGVKVGLAGGRPAGFSLEEIPGVVLGKTEVTLAEGLA